MTKQDPTSPAPTSSDRDSVREEANFALCRALAGRPFRPMLLLGSRPNARRAFLEDLAREGESLGFLVSRIDAGEENFIGRLRFLQNGSRLDFLFFHKVTKEPLAVVEVEGYSFHREDTRLAGAAR